MRRLLFIAHRVPYPPDKGERLRAFHEIRALSRHFRITLAALAHGREDALAAQPLGQWCEKVLVVPAGGWRGLARGALSLLAGGSVTEGYFRNQRLQDLLPAEAAREPVDLVLCYSSGTLPYGLAVPARSRVMDLVDVDSEKWAGYADRARWPRSWLYRREATGVGRLERHALEAFDAVVLTSRAEVAALGASSEKVTTVGNGVDADYFSPELVQPVDLGPASIVFTGTMDYRPNVEGVCWFVREVWPSLHRSVLVATFTIVGRNPVRAVRRLQRIPGVTVTGSVTDVRPYLAGARIAVCPLRIARGVQNKVLEAMAMGKPVVASAPALEGLELAVGREVLCADTPAEWLQTLKRLLNDAKLRARLGQAARQRARASYVWPSCLAPLVSICRDLAEGDSRKSRTRGARLDQQGSVGKSPAPATEAVGQ